MSKWEEMRFYVYIDGQYVREEFRREGLADDTFDPPGPAYSAHVTNPARIFYYDAIDEGADEDEKRRQRDYLDWVQSQYQTHVIIGRVRQGKRSREQKGVDVQLAIDALQAANRGIIEGIILVTGDADFEPLAKAIRDVGPYVYVVAFKRSLSKYLRLAADGVVAHEKIPGIWIAKRREKPKADDG
jgi:uncharacterized LabA/DUF88 family protein